MRKTTRIIATITLAAATLLPAAAASATGIIAPEDCPQGSSGVVTGVEHGGEETRVYACQNLV